MHKIYNPHKIESKVQKYWYENDIFKVTEESKKKKYYCLSMLPYPSGKLHIGHIRNYTIGDVISRYQRMLGKNVLHPMGWDAFGLPAEEAAIKNNIHPSIWTYSNIQYMKKQLKSMGFGYDWSREIITCCPKYYRWEQWFFIYLYKKGLVYKKKSIVNWCEKEKTVLANEQVINGCCWRCDTKTEYKEIPQWFIKITNYADELLTGLNTLTHWPEQVKIMQRNWIGKKEGIEITLCMIHNDIINKLNVYTTRPEILMGATYIIISIQHPLSLKMFQLYPKFNDFIQKYKITTTQESCISKIEKNGIFTGLYAIHPFTQEKLPIWIINIIPTEYNIEHAIIATPGHNQDELEFAYKYKLPIKLVIQNIHYTNHNSNQKITQDGILYNSKQFNGLTCQEGYKAIVHELTIRGIGQYKTLYRLHDWGISRQRYWGAPIPMLTLQDGTIVPIPEEQLPIILPNNFQINETMNPLKTNTNWAKTTYHGQSALRETDTFDTFMESSWYYARYTCPNYDDKMLDTNSINYWLPIDQYIGGIEHAIMHLMYFRFYHKLLRDAGLVNSNEPAIRLLCQGMVITESFYYITNEGEHIWVSPQNVKVERDSHNNIINATHILGFPVIYAGMKKMSKSKNNGVDPQSIVEKYGADTIRLFIMFTSPVEANLIWNISGIEGSYRFLKKIWKLTYEHLQSGTTEILNINLLDNEQKKLRYEIHRTIIKVTDDIDRRQMFNTAIAAMMELTNKLIRAKRQTNQDRALLHEALLILIRMLYPFVPHICFVLWKNLGNKKNIDSIEWPIADDNVIKKYDQTILIQVNGKFRGKITVPINSDQTIVCQKVYQQNYIMKYIIKKIKNIIYVPNKLLNFIIEK